MTNTYTELADFIQRRMRMSHVYQPVVLKTLLSNGGECSERELAKELLLHDESQIEYYIKITNNMVGRVLRNHNYVNRDKTTKTYELVGYKELSQGEVEELARLCEIRFDAFLEQRGETIFNHRKLSKGYISGTVKYEVLKRAKFRCELCGISADQKALEVDHILPRNLGGKDDLSNFQALCYSCNAMKRDRDDTDFRAVRESYEHREAGCRFCVTAGQYFYNFNIEDGWAFGAGPTFSYNHKAASGNKLTLPIGIGGSKTAFIGGRPWRFGLQYWYYAESPDNFGPEHQIRLQIAPVVKIPWRSLSTFSRTCPVSLRL